VIGALTKGEGCFFARVIAECERGEAVPKGCEALKQKFPGVVEAFGGIRYRFEGCGTHARR
jgi:hypothetical protein